MDRRTRAFEDIFARPASVCFARFVKTLELNAPFSGMLHLHAVNSNSNSLCHMIQIRIMSSKAIERMGQLMRLPVNQTEPRYTLLRRRRYHMELLQAMARKCQTGLDQCSQRHNNGCMIAINMLALLPQTFLLKDT